MKNLNQFPLWTAIVTPMNQDGSIDFDSFKNILQEQNKAKNAVVILGSTGEALNLNKDECKKILEFGLSLNLDVPVMTGIGGYNLEECLNYVDYLNNLKGLDAYLVVTPIYAKPGEHGQTHWFKSILDRSIRPCMIYNVPSRAGVKLNVNAVKTLHGHKNFWAIKEASGSVEDFKNYKDAAPNVRMYSGDDGMMYEFAPHNLKGLVSVASNAWPLQTHLYTQKAIEQKLTTEEAALWQKASDSLFIASNPVPVKNLMFANKQIKTNLLRAPLSAKDLSDNTPLLQAQAAVNEWFKKH